MRNAIKWTIFILLIFFDQLSKFAALSLEEPLSIIPNILEFSLVKNYGGVFGVAQGSNIVLATLSGIIILIILLSIIILTYKREHISFALYIILAGGIGNFIDRIYRGFVVDFIKTPFIATFNIADSLIVVGVFLIIFSEIIRTYKGDNKNEI